MKKQPTEGKPAVTPRPTKAAPSSAPLLERLQIKAGVLVLLRPPQGFVERLTPVPAGVTVQDTTTDNPSVLYAAPQYDAVLLFVENKQAIDDHAQQAIDALKPGGLLWLAYPKRTGSIRTDINRDSGWDALTAAGWEGVRQIAIDETWSALRFRPRDEIRRRGS